jgi:FkbM family methyltransferase
MGVGYITLRVMAITPAQARSVTGIYSLARRSGLLESSVGARLFRASYFIYKRYLEDPFAGLVRQHPGLFRNGDILDVGANIGYTAALFAEAADPDAKVYAFEPEPFNFRLLRQTISDRGLESRVVPLQSAVGKTNGEIQLWINDHHHADHRIATDALRAKGERAHDGYIEVPIVTLDTFVSQSGSSKAVCLIKVDVQGYELSVCEGMGEVIQRNPEAAVAIEYMPEAMQDLGYAPHALLEWFEQREFRMYSLSRNGQLIRGMGEELAKNGYVDLIFTRKVLV